MEFEYEDWNVKKKIIVLRNSGVVIFLHESKPEHNGMYIPSPVMIWNGALKRSFDEMLQYIETEDVLTLNCGKVIKRKHWLRADVGGGSPKMTLMFYPWSCPFDQTYVSFFKAADFYMDALRLVQGRIRTINANHRRLAMAMSLHPRLGAGSVLHELVSGEVMRSILDFIAA